MISNMHTHTYFCDGENSPEEMVLTAIDAGMEALGFSGHSYFPEDSYCPGMSPENERLYRAEIRRLQTVYDGQIHLLTGVEQDFDSPVQDGQWDYRIGSIHYMYGEGRFWSIDATVEQLRAMVETLYGGDMLSFVQAYFEKEKALFTRMHPDIVGHFDLYRKFNDTHHYLDESDPRYLAMARETLLDLLHAGALFELNLGAVARGKAVQPYPSIPLLQILQKEKARLIITTDGHRASLLAASYPEAVRPLAGLGFDAMIVRGAEGFREVSLR